MKPSDPSYPKPSSERITAVMKGNKRVDTKPEIRVRSILHRKGYRFRKDFLVRTQGLQIRPDIVFTKKRIAIFIDGCYWHVCPLHGCIPNKNAAYWAKKLKGNVDRDKRNTHALESEGWTVLRIWEHIPVKEAVDEIIKTLEKY